MSDSRLSGADDVTRLEPLGALQQIELDGFALIQRAVTILLDSGEMNEDILPSGPLDKTVSFSPVKPLHSTLLSHNELLSPLPRLEFHILREARASLSPSKHVDETGRAWHAVEHSVQQERLLSSAPWVEKTAQSSGACRGGASFDCHAQNINLN
jgi:hypothetical protein